MLKIKEIFFLVFSNEVYKCVDMGDPNGHSELGNQLLPY